MKKGSLQVSLKIPGFKFPAISSFTFFFPFTYFFNLFSIGFSIIKDNFTKDCSPVFYKEMHGFISFKAFFNLVSHFPVFFGLYSCPEYNTPDILAFQEFIDLFWFKGADYQYNVMIFDHGLFYQGIRCQ